MPSQLGYFICGLIVLLAFSSCTFSQLPPPYNYPSGGEARCVNLTDVESLYPGTIIPEICYDYILWPNSVYVDNNTVVRNTYGRIGLGSGNWAAPSCLLASARHWCTLMFRPCVEIATPSGGTAAVGQYSCYEYCSETQTACYGAIVDSLAGLGQATPQIIAQATSCTPPWIALYGAEYPGTPMFPNSTYTVNMSDSTGTYFTFSLPCNNVNENITTQPPPALCPDGLYYQDGFCIFNCPEPIISDSEYDAISVMISVMGWISFISSAFLALTFLMDPDKRRFPANLSIYFILCIMCLSFSFCIGNMAGWRNVWCDDNDKPNLWGGPACTIQGIIFVYFTLASVLWWLVLSINLLLMVLRVQPNSVRLDWVEYFRGLNKPRGLWRWESLMLAYHISAWFPPFIPLIIALGAERLGYNGHDVWCTIHSGDPVSFTLDDTGKVGYTGGDPANIWNLLLLTIPILSTVALGSCILIFVVVWGIWKSGWRFFYQQWRLFLFIMFFIWIYTFVFSFQIHLAVQTDKQYQAYTEYINCKNVQTVLEATNSPVIQPLDCPPVSSEISFPLWFIVAFNEASQGLLLFLLYGTSFRFFKTWYLLFTNPKALWSSRYATSSGEGNQKTHFTVAGRKVAGSTATVSQHMVDEIESEGEEGSTTTATSDSDDDDEEEREGTEGGEGESKIEGHEMKEM